MTLTKNHLIEASPDIAYEQQDICYELGSLYGFYTTDSAKALEIYTEAIAIGNDKWQESELNIFYWLRGNIYF